MLDVYFPLLQGSPAYSHNSLIRPVKCSTVYLNKVT